MAAANGMRDWRDHPLAVRSLQEYHEGVTASPAGGAGESGAS
jgi:hypothetical protein